MVVIVFFESFVAISAILAATYLSSIGKDGWGFLYLLLVVLLLGCVKIKLGDDTCINEHSVPIKEIQNDKN